VTRLEALGRHVQAHARLDVAQLGDGDGRQDAEDRECDHHLQQGQAPIRHAHAVHGMDDEQSRDHRRVLRTSRIS
jgi:hypothetical protein